MKIVCDSCGAKYSIADEKVAGKVFKIRCKKCSEVIVVRGEQNEFEDDESTRVFDYGGDAVWHVVIDGEQQGPFAPLQIEAYLTGGRIDADAYVWKEGFDGWKALREVPELSSLVAATADPVDAADLFASAESDADVFGSAAPAPAAKAEPKAVEKPATDLFAASAKSASPFDAASGDDDGLVASAPSPRVSASQASMTGQRNENSVLFSLSNLQALATGGPAAPAAAAAKPAASAAASPFAAPAPIAAAPAPKPAGHATGEGSGLIDIRALASAANTVSAPKAASSSGGGVDDLLSIGGGSALTSGLGAPMLAPAVKDEPEKKSNVGLYVAIGFGAVALSAAVVMGFVILNREPETRVVERVVVQGGGEAAAPAAAAPAAAAPAAAAPEAAAPAAAAPSTGSSRTASTREGRTTSMGAASAPSTMASAAAAPAAAAPAPSAMSSQNLDLDQLLNMAVAMNAPAETAMADSSLPETPSRDAVRSALTGVSGAVRACGGGEHGLATVAVTFRNSGAVSSANVSGPFAGTPVGSCVSSAVRGAHVPPFRNPTFSVNYPFAL